MNKLLFIVLILQPTFGKAQTNKDSILPPPVGQTDSFSFCSKKFKVPRNCDSKDSPECCIFYGTSFIQLGCSEYDYINWSELPDLKLAKTIYEGLIKEGQNVESQRNNNKYHVQPLFNLYILDTLATEACYIESGNLLEEKHYLLFAYGVANKQMVIVQYHANSDILRKLKSKPLFANILTWK